MELLSENDAARMKTFIQKASFPGPSLLTIKDRQKMILNEILKEIGEKCLVRSLGPELHYIPEKSLYIELQNKKEQHSLSGHIAFNDCLLVSARDSIISDDDIRSILGPKGDYGMSAWLH